MKLLDFGVATLLDEASGLPVSRTHTVGRALTPAYAAPEQMQGGAVTTATDVYALGVLLYELLSGIHPTAASAATPAAFARAVTEVEPERASAVVAAMHPATAETARLVAERATTRERLSRSLRGDLDNILAKALRKRPADRYAAAAALAEDVRRYLLDQPVHARPDPPGTGRGSSSRATGWRSGLPRASSSRWPSERSSPLLRLEAPRASATAPSPRCDERKSPTTWRPICYLRPPPRDVPRRGRSSSLAANR